MEIKGSVIVITGAASGIGEATALALAKAGGKIVLGDLQEEKLLQVKEAIIKSGGIAAASVLNVTSEGSVQQLMDFAIQEFGQINVLITCAGIIRDSYLVTPDRETKKIKKFMTTEQWKQVIDVNLTGVFLSVREAVIRMADHQWEAVIILLSSINKAGELGQLNYASTKASIALWPKILAGEFHARGIHNIRVAAIAPGYVETPLLQAMKPEVLEAIVREVPIGRLVQTDEIVSTIQFIMENRAVHGTTLEISGGIIGKGLAK